MFLSAYKKGINAAFQKVGFTLFDPNIALPIIGSLAGESLAGKMMPKNVIGTTMGRVVGMSSGASLAGDLKARREKQQMMQQLATQQPQQTPYAIDDSVEDIPAWALQSAQILSPYLKKNASDAGFYGTLGEGFGQLPNLHRAYKDNPDHPVQGVIRQGIIPGAIGMGAAFGLDKLLEHHNLGKIPFTNTGISEALPTMLGPLAGLVAYNALRK